MPPLRFAGEQGFFPGSRFVPASFSTRFQKMRASQVKRMFAVLLTDRIDTAIHGPDLFRLHRILEQGILSLQALVQIQQDNSCSPIDFLWIVQGVEHLSDDSRQFHRINTWTVQFHLLAGAIKILFLEIGGDPFRC